MSNCNWISPFIFPPPPPPPPPHPAPWLESANATVPFYRSEEKEENWKESSVWAEKKKEENREGKEGEEGEEEKPRRRGRG